MRHQKDLLRPPRGEDPLDVDQLACAQGRLAVRLPIRGRVDGVRDWRDACHVTR